MQCELCGRSADLVKAKVEGVVLDVCPECASFGVVVRKPRSVLQPRQPSKPAVPEVKEHLVEGFPEHIRKQREKLGLTQEAFARMLAERESLVQKMEAGTYVPSLDVARKIERILKIKLIEEEAVDAAIAPPGKQATYTLGDFLKRC